MRIGIHVSIAGKIYEALERGHAAGCDTIQIFSRNPRGWQAAKLDKDDVSEFKALKAKYDIRPVVVHIPYIINLATPDDKLYKRSIKAYIEDIKRADLLGAEYFVTHLGSHVGSGEDKGIGRFSSALNEIIEKARPKTNILLETTAGSGSWIGYEFEHIGRIIEALNDRKNVNVCFDTAHVFEAGYDIKTTEGLNSTLKEFDKLIGLELIKVVHFNDSKSPLSSHVDRHEYLGKGKIGLAALARIINHPKLKNAAFIMETPKEKEDDDRMSVNTARRMYKGR
ncbi:MAG: deoxyribonuclease IV [Candidatus Omnitrophica bacterium]|nr:deoxyribonuclease IV [Candidatus Omnitrophota bacterium]